jgi:hypothetical protein
MRECPDCLSVLKLQGDYPSSFWQSLLQSLRIIRVKRCPNCNAAVFLVLGVYTTSRRKLSAVGERTFWFLFIGMILILGFVFFEAIMS